MSERATCWSVTINMKSVSKETADECISRAHQAGWKVEGQLEKGDEGTLHYQLMVNTPQTRFSAIKKMFPTAHIEVARKPSALKAYVHKEDTREGELPTQNEFYPSLSKFWDLLVEHLVPLEPGEGRNPRRRLDQLDATASILIKKGYHIEGIAVNPSTRSAWNTFNVAIMERSKNEKLRREETDRQTDRQVEISSDDIIIPTIQNGEEGNYLASDGSSETGEGYETDSQEPGSDSFGSDDDEELSSDGFSDEQDSSSDFSEE